MANDIAEVLAIQEDMGCRLTRLSESRQRIYETAGHTRELLTDLPHGLVFTPPSPDEQLVAGRREVNKPSLTLADELATVVPFHSRVPSEIGSADDRATPVSGDNTLCQSEDDELDTKDEFELPIVDSRFEDAHSRTLAEQVASRADTLNIAGETSPCSDALLSADDSVVLRGYPHASTSDALQPSVAPSPTAVVSALNPVPPIRLFVAYLTSLTGVKVRTPTGVVQWIEDAKSKPAVKTLQDTYTVSAISSYEGLY